MLILFTPVALPGPNSALEIQQEACRLLTIFPSTEGCAPGLYTKMDSMGMEAEGPGSLVCRRGCRREGLVTSTCGCRASLFSSLKWLETVPTSQSDCEAQPDHVPENDVLTRNILRQVEVNKKPCHSLEAVRFKHPLRTATVCQVLYKCHLCSFSPNAQGTRVYHRERRELRELRQLSKVTHLWYSSLATSTPQIRVANEDWNSR